MTSYLRTVGVSKALVLSQSERGEGTIEPVGIVRQFK